MNEEELNNLAHELWESIQLHTQERSMEGVDRIIKILKKEKERRYVCTFCGYNFVASICCPKCETHH